MIRRPPKSPLFPYPTLFRSVLRARSRDELQGLPPESRRARRARRRGDGNRGATRRQDRKSTRLNSSHSQISYAVFCLKKKKKTPPHRPRLASLSMRVLLPIK